MAKTSTTTATALEGQTQDAKTALKQVLDDLYGLLDDTTVAFTTTTILSKFPANSFTNAVLLQLVQDGAFVADAATRALFGTGFFTAAMMTENFLTADADGRARFAAGFFDQATVLAKFAADSFDNAVLLDVIADGAFVANAATRALFADGIWDAAKLAVGVITADALGRALFANDVLDAATLAAIVADDAMTTAFLLAAVNADAITNAVLLSAVLDGAFVADAGTRALFADGIWNTAKLAVGVISADAPGRALFAAGIFDAATVLSAFAADSFTNAVLLDIVLDGAFVADAATRALFADGIWTAGKLDALPRRHVARTIEFDIDIGAATTQDVVLLRPSTAITVTAARIVYSEQTSGVCAAGTMQLGTTVGGAEISAATNLENAKGVGTSTALAIVSGAVAANTPVIARYTGVAAAVVGTVVAEIEYQVDA